MFGICMISFLLPGALNDRLTFLDFLLLGIFAGLVLAGTVPAHTQDGRGQQGGTNEEVGQRSAQERVHARPFQLRGIWKCGPSLNFFQSPPRPYRRLRGVEVSEVLIHEAALFVCQCRFVSK